VKECQRSDFQLLFYAGYSNKKNFEKSVHKIITFNRGSHAPVKKNAYRVNPVKRNLMKL